MKNLKLKLAAIVLVTISFVSCSKDDEPTSNPATVYPFLIAGMEEDTNSSDYIAKYWEEDGTEHILSTTTENVSVYNYFLDGNDIHIVGQDDNSNKGKYYKNGTEVNVNVSGATGNSYFYDVFVTGNDVYIAGSQYISSVPVAKYWKNGNEVILGNGTEGSWLYSIFVSGNDVYALGGEGSQVVYWKNGNKVVLGNSSEGFAIVADGNDVYIAGTIVNTTIGGYKAVYWKNGVEMTLEGANTIGSRAYDIKVKNGDIYASGYIGSEAVYWKNGIRHDLDRGVNTSFATSSKIYFVNNDMYVTGREYYPTLGNYILKYWKNEVPFNLSDGTTDVYEANVYN